MKGAGDTQDAVGAIGKSSPPERVTQKSVDPVNPAAPRRHDAAIKASSAALNSTKAADFSTSATCASSNAKTQSANSSTNGQGNPDDTQIGVQSSSPRVRMAFRRARAEERIAARNLRGSNAPVAGAAAADNARTNSTTTNMPTAVGQVIAEQVQQLNDLQQQTWDTIQEFCGQYEERRRNDDAARKQTAEQRKALLQEVLSELREEKTQALQPRTSLTSPTTLTRSSHTSSHGQDSQCASLREAKATSDAPSTGARRPLINREELLSLSCPIELSAAFEEMKAVCAAADEKKKKVEQQLDEEKEMRDEAFVKALKEQREEMSQLLNLMRNQYQDLQTKYREALRLIEDKMEQERLERVSRNKEELDALFERRKNMEEHEIIDSRSRRYEEFEEAFEQQRQKDEIDHQARKLDHQRVIQELERHLDKMMAAYQLNKEKLDYNVHVLAERNKENAALVLAYKNKANRCRGALSVIIEKFNSMEKKYNLANAHYTEEFKRLRCQYQQIREQSALFKTADEQLYRETWRSHEQEARQLVALLLEADKSIHEQQLCLPFTAPAEAEAGGASFFEEDTTTYDGLSEVATTTFHSGSSSGKVDSFQKSHGAPSVSAFSACRSILGTRSKEGSERTGTDGGAGALKSHFSAEKLKKVLDLIAEACRFLIASHGKQTEDLSEEEQQLVEVHSILESVGVTCQADLDLLVSMFYQGQDDDDETLYFDADDVLRLLEDFMEEKHNLALAEIVPDNDKKRNHRQQTQGRKESDKERRLRHKKEVQRFWNKLSKVIPDIHLRVWGALDRVIEKYHRLLVSRSEVLAQILVAEKRCESLSLQLKAFENSSINRELLVPPTINHN